MRLETYGIGGCIPRRRNRLSLALPQSLALVCAGFGKSVACPRKKLAATSDIDWTYLGQVERGRRNLSLHNILRVARTLGVDAGKLMHGLQEFAGD